MKKSYSTVLDPEIYKKLIDLSNKTLIPQARLIEKALKLLFEEYEKSSRD